MVMGAPTKYNAEVLQAAKDYLENCPDALPSVVGLAVKLRIARDTLIEWAKQEDKKDFSDTLRLINDQQHHVAVNKGITGEFSGPITKLVLHNHGYSEKTEVDNKSSDRSMSPKGTNDLTDQELDDELKKHGIEE